MAKKKIAGVNVLLEASIDGGTSFQVVGGQSGATLNRDTNVLEVTSKDANGWAENIAGIKSWSVECEGFLVEDDEGLDALETAWENGDAVRVKLAYNKKLYSGEAILSSFPNEFPQDDAVTFSLSFTGTGALERVPESAQA